MRTKLRALQRRFPRFRLASMIGLPMGVSLWLISVFSPYYAILQAPHSVSQINIYLENGMIRTSDMRWHGQGPPTNWWTLENHLVVAHPLDLSETMQPSEYGWAAFFGLDFIFYRDPDFGNDWAIAIWPIIPLAVLLAWLILRATDALLTKNDEL